MVDILISKKRYWLWGIVIGVILAIILDLILSFSLQTRCLEPLSCAGKLSIFFGALRFFIPAGAIIGLLLGLIFEKRFPLALGVLAVGVIAYFAFGQRSILNNQMSTTISTPTSSPAQIPRLSPTPAQSDQVKNWQVYINEQYGFEMQYPRDWYAEGFQRNQYAPVNLEFTVGFGIPNVAPESRAHWRLDIYKRTGQLNQQIIDLNNSIFDKSKSFVNIKQEKIKIDDLNATKFIYTTGEYPDIYQVVIYVEKGGLLFEISNDASKDIKFDQFVNSLQFK